MTIQEFLTVLTRMAPMATWQYQQDPDEPTRYLIRTVTSARTPYRVQCPVSFVGDTEHTLAVVAAEQLIGLSHADTIAIMRAADDTPSHDPVLREAIIQAIGLYNHETNSGMILEMVHS